MEGFKTRVAALQHRSADLQKRIRELGMVPMEQVERVRNHSAAAKKRELADVQRQLQAHTCVICARTAFACITTLDMPTPLCRLPRAGRAPGGDRARGGLVEQLHKPAGQAA